MGDSWTVANVRAQPSALLPKSLYRVHPPALLSITYSQLLPPSCYAPTCCLPSTVPERRRAPCPAAPAPQPSDSRIERVRTITGVLERLRQMEAGPEPQSAWAGLSFSFARSF